MKISDAFTPHTKPGFWLSSSLFLVYWLALSLAHMLSWASVPSAESMNRARRYYLFTPAWPIAAISVFLPLRQLMRRSRFQWTSLLWSPTFVKDFYPGLTGKMFMTISLACIRSQPKSGAPTPRLLLCLK